MFINRGVIEKHFFSILPHFPVIDQLRYNWFGQGSLGQGRPRDTCEDMKLAKNSGLMGVERKIEYLNSLIKELIS